MKLEGGKRESRVIQVGHNSIFGGLVVMATGQRVAQSSVSASPINCGSSKARSESGDVAAVSDQFPEGLRVLVVDDDTTCLRILEQMLRRCLYHVTTCSQASVALNLLREKKGCFDVVLSDVHMPDMDGYKLLEYVGLEMDLPVIMMSADKRTSAVMKGIRHGACDYLIKPIRYEELKNIWQHIVRKKWNECKELENSGSLENNDKQKRGTDDTEYACCTHEGGEGITQATKRRNSTKEEDCELELENDDPSVSKKPRVVWSVELHQQFVSAVNQLGLDKAVPKRILELMNVPGLTRENVASHLQKFRLYLKRLSGVAQQQAFPNIYCGPFEQNVRLDSFGVETLAIAGRIPPQTLAAMQAELFGRPMGNLIPPMDQAAVLQQSSQEPKFTTIEHDPINPFSQTLVKRQTSDSKTYPPSIIAVDDVTSAYSSTWPSNSQSVMGPNNHVRTTSQDSNMLVGIMQEQQQDKRYQEWQQQQKQCPQHAHRRIFSEPSSAINVQPSCLVLPSHPSFNLLPESSPGTTTRNQRINRGTIIDYSLASPQLNSSISNFNQISHGDLKPLNTVSATGYSAQVLGSPKSSYSVTVAANNYIGQVYTSGMTFQAGSQLSGVVRKSDKRGSYDSKSEEILDHGHIRNLGFVCKETSFQSPSSDENIVLPMTDKQIEHRKKNI